MLSEEFDLGVVCNSEGVKSFVKNLISSNLQNEKWNYQNETEINKGKLNPKKRVPICIWGNHGIGKTELLKALANELTTQDNLSSDEKWLFTSVAPAQFEEMGDLHGMPNVVDPDEKISGDEKNCVKKYLQAFRDGDLIKALSELDNLSKLNPKELIQQRRDKFLKIGRNI